MPKCINDSKSTCKGSEPSPKGKGYCAHAESVGMTMTGLNKKIWIVKQYANGQKRWIQIRDSQQTRKKSAHTVKKTNKKERSIEQSSRTTNVQKTHTNKSPKQGSPSSVCDDFVFMKRIHPKHTLQNELIGKLVDGNQFYEWKSYNTFKHKPRTLRKNFLDNFEKKSISNDQLNNTYCGDKKRVDEISFNKSLHDGYRNKTFIQHNGYWVCMVCFKDNKAYVYTIENEDDLIIEHEHYESDWLYTKLIFTFPYKKVFEASDTSDEYENSGYVSGNTILLQNKDHKYTYIGAEIYQFDTEDVIEKYYCAEFSSWVPYPVAIGSQYAYFLLDHTCVPMKHMHKIDSSEWYKAYHNYYGFHGNKSNKLSKYAVKMKNVKSKM